MRPAFLGLALLSVVLSALSQIALKTGMSSPAVQAAIAQSNIWRIVSAVSHSWPVLAGMACFGLSALVWLAVLSRMPLSTAYPFVALGIAITTGAGIIFHEPLTMLKIAGVFLIICGVVTVALSS